MTELIYELSQKNMDGSRSVSNGYYFDFVLCITNEITKNVLFRLGFIFNSDDNDT